MGLYTDSDGERVVMSVPFSGLESSYTASHLDFPLYL